MDNELFNRILFVYFKKRFPLPGGFDADSGLDGDPQGTGGKDVIQKAVKFFRKPQKAGAAVSGSDRSGWAAEIEVDDGVPVPGQLSGDTEKMLRAVCENLGDDIHAGVVFRENVVKLPAAQFFVGNKRGEIAVCSAVVPVKRVPVYVAGQSFHRRQVKFYGFIHLPRLLFFYIYHIYCNVYAVHLSAAARGRRPAG